MAEGPTLWDMETIIKLMAIIMRQRHKHRTGNPNEVEDRPGRLRQTIMEQTDLITA